jgi:DnaJ-class molecular chaperone
MDEIKIEAMSEEDHKKYEEELCALGWCLECQGYGQDHGDGSPCQKCNGTGKTQEQL